MDKPLWFRWLRVYAVGGAIILSGFILFKYTTPTDEDIINALSPELRLQYERERKLRQAEQQELMKIVQRTTNSNDPIWKTGPIQSPWERNTGELETHEQFQRLKADQIQKEELERIRQELDQIRQQTSLKTNEISKNKSWWNLW